jgi:hypothetical protein
MRLGFLLLFLLFSTGLHATKIRGIVKDQNHEPLSFASVVVKGQAQGTMANEQGEFILELPGGSTYELVFQFLGYKSVLKTVELGAEEKFIEVFLEAQSIQLSEVQVGKGKEDPAYAIMRKAIAKSKINDKQVDHYDADVYVKNTLIVNKVPALLKKKLAENNIKVGVPFVSESLTNIKFTQPNKRVTRVLAKKVSFDEMDVSGAYYLVNFYDLPDDLDLISPLSPKAFAYYKFEYLGFFEDRGRVVNKIKIIPRTYGPGVCRGTIYIIDDLWSIHSIDAETINQGFTIKMKQLYSPQQEVWVPVSQTIDFSGKVFGFDFGAKMQVHPKYKSLRLNQKYIPEVKVLDKFDAPKRKAKKEVSLQSEELTLKDLRKLSKQIEKEDKKEKTVAIQIDSVSRDSLASRRSAEYWAEIRSIPLTAEESKSYTLGDSIRVVAKQTDSVKTAPKKTKYPYFDKVFIGGTKKLPGKWKLEYTSPLLPFFGLNYTIVEGIFADSKLNFSKTTTNKTKYAWNNQLRYSFGLERLMGSSTFAYTHKRQSLYVGARNMTLPYDSIQKIPNWANSIVNLFKINLMQVYRQESAFLGYAYQKPNIFTAQSRLEFSRRYPLENLASLPIELGKRTPTSNTPWNAEIDTSRFSPHNALVWSTSLRYRPGAQYKILNGKRLYHGSPWPTFTLNYSKGMADVDYDFISLGIDDQLKSGPGEHFRYYLEGGSFLNHRSVHLMDMRHVNSIRITDVGSYTFYRLLNTRLPIQISPENYYRYSTQGSYLKLHAVNEFRKLFLTQIPLVRFTPLKEDLFINYLKTPALKNYLEVGYGLDGIFRLLRVEVIAAFEQGYKPRWGWQLGVTF